MCSGRIGCTMTTDALRVPLTPPKQPMTPHEKHTRLLAEIAALDQIDLAEYGLEGWRADLDEWLRFDVGDIEYFWHRRRAALRSMVSMLHSSIKAVDRARASRDKYAEFQARQMRSDRWT